MIRRWLLAAVLCCVATAGFADQSMRSDQFPGRPWAWSGVQSEPPCAAPTTSGAVTLDLTTCATPVSGSIGSPQYYQIPLTGNITSLTLTNPKIGEVFRIDFVAGSFTVAMFPFVGPSPATAVSGNSSIVCGVHDATPTYWCPGGVIAGLVPPSSAPSVVQGNFGAKVTSGTTFSVTMASALTAGNAVACEAVYNGSGAISGVSDGTNTYTSLDGPVTIGTGKMQTFRVLSLTGSPTTITATISAAVTFGGIECAEVHGATTIDVHALNPQANLNGNVADSITSGNVTTTSTNELLVGLSLVTNGAQINAGTGQTLVIHDTSTTGFGASIEYKPAPTAGSYASTFTAATDSTLENYATAGIALH